MKKIEAARIVAQCNDDLDLAQLQLGEFSNRLLRLTKAIDGLSSEIAAQSARVSLVEGKLDLFSRTLRDELRSVRDAVAMAQNPEFAGA